MLSRRRFMNDRIASENGDNLVLQNVKGSKMNALTVYGKSEQRTTTGAQLVNLPDTNAKLYKGITWECKNGIITANGTSTFTSTSSAAGINGTLKLPAGDYYISGRNENIGVHVSIKKEDGSFDYYSGNFSIDEEKTVTAYAQVDRAGITVNNVIVYIMLNSGSTALPWEPYTGGQPSPNPDYPQEIKSVGDSGTVNVTLSDGGSQSQTLPVQTPNGLPGIPVDSDGNYTDESGQQWVCDEIDLARGKYVQRVGKINVTLVDSYDSSEEYGTIINPSNLLNTGLRVPILSNYFHYDKSIKVDGIGFGHLNVIRLYYALGSVEAFNEWLSQNDVVVYYPFATPIETDLPAEEIAAYKALRTYSPTTTVSNDAVSWMKVGYREWRR